MAAVGKRQVQAFDLDAFEDDGGDIDSPGLMQMFVKQNKRVLKIFESENSDTEEPIENQSYGLRLVSRSNGQDENNSSTTRSSPLHNGEKDQVLAEANIGQHKEQPSQLNVRNLSPIDIVTLSSEDVSENSASLRKAQPGSSMSKLRFKPNQSMRRSLFSSEHFPPSSTPLAPTRKTNGNVFKDAFESILSPIKQPQPKEAVTPKAIQLHSFKQIEQDLQQMFGTKEMGSTQKSAIPANQWVVQLERMQVDENAMPECQNQQESIASVAPNRTNLNHCSMIETPIVQRNAKEKPDYNEDLAQKLRLCETTSDESTEAPPENMQTEMEAAIISEAVPDILHTALSRPSGSESRNTRNKKNISIQPAAVGATDHIENRTPSETSQTCNDSISKTLDPAVMKSFRNLSKRPHAQDQPQLKESFKFVQPKRRKAASGKVASSTAKYLDMTRQKTTKKTKESRTASKKRTLYSQDDDEHEEGRSSSQQNLMVENTSAPETIEKSKQSDVSHSKLHKRTKNFKELSRNKPKAVSSSDETSDTDGEKEDEGFDSEDFHESFDDVRYDPYERGCKRPGLRVRRYANPYWINNGTARNYAVTYGVMTKRLCKEEEKLVRHGRTADNKNNKTEAVKFGSAMVVNAFSSLRQARERKTETKTAARKAENIVSKNSEVESTQNGQSTAKSTYSFSSVVQAIASSKKTENSVMRDSYNLAPINSVQFRDCGEGLYFGAFIDGKADGIIKLIPGGRKKLARSKYSSLKFFVLEGSVDITCNNESLRLERFGFLDINANYYYTLSNSSDQDVFIQFTRFDRRRE